MERLYFDELLKNRLAELESSKPIASLSSTKNKLIGLDDKLEFNLDEFNLEKQLDDELASKGSFLGLNVSVGDTSLNKFNEITNEQNKNLNNNENTLTFENQTNVLESSSSTKKPAAKLVERLDPTKPIKTNLRHSLRQSHKAKGKHRATFFFILR
jgi:hypothetical protein